MNFTNFYHIILQTILIQAMADTPYACHYTFGFWKLLETLIAPNIAAIAIE